MPRDDRADAQPAPSDEGIEPRTSGVGSADDRADGSDERPEGAAAFPARHPATPAGLVRNAAAGRLLEQFFVAAAAAVLGIRIYLDLTGYPQLGGNGLHIAHMLWGGLGMLVAVVAALAFLGAQVRTFVAVVGGAGFGTFIDELGKFITSDNDYFFQPTIALIYGIFVVLYLGFNAIVGRATLTPAAALAQAIDLIEAGTIHGFTPNQRSRVLALLRQCDPDHPLVGPLRAAMAEVRTLPAPFPNVFERVVGMPWRGYEWLASKSWFLVLVLGLALLQALTGVATVVGEVVEDPAFRLADWSLSAVDVIKAVGQGIATLLVFAGLLRLASSQLAAYQWFKRAVLVSLLLVQPMSFYVSELAAAWGLLFNLSLFGSLNLAISRERAMESREVAASTGVIQAPAAPASP